MGKKEGSEGKGASQEQKKQHKSPKPLKHAAQEDSERPKKGEQQQHVALANHKEKASNVNGGSHGSTPTVKKQGFQQSGSHAGSSKRRAVASHDSSDDEDEEDEEEDDDSEEIEDDDDDDDDQAAPMTNVAPLMKRLGARQPGVLPQNKSVLDLFQDLVSTDPSVRLQSSKSLLEHMISAQQTHNAESKQNADPYAANNVLCGDVLYACKRLVRGLASSNGAARQGFAVVLTELLLSVPEIQVSVILDFVNSSLQTSNTMKSSEQKNALFGRLVTYNCLVRSNRLGPSLSHEESKSILPRLFADIRVCSESKSFIQHIACETAVLLIDHLSPSQFQEFAVKPLGSWAVEEPSTPESLVYALVLAQKLRGLKKGQKGGFFEVPKIPGFSHADITDPSNCDALASVLKYTVHLAPMLHRVWLYLFEAFTQTPYSRECRFNKFWDTVIERGFFANVFEKKSFGFLVIKHALSVLPLDYLHAVFSHRMLPIFCFSVRTPSDNYHDKSKECLDALMARVDGLKNASKETDAALRALIDILSSPRGFPVFDQFTKTATIRTMVGHLTDIGLRTHVEKVSRVLLHGFSDSQVDPERDVDLLNVEVAREWAVSELLSLSRHLSAHGGNVTAVFDDVIKLMFVSALCTLSEASSKDKSKPIYLEAPRVPFSEKTHRLLRERLDSFLFDFDETSNARMLHLIEFFHSVTSTGICRLIKDPGEAAHDAVAKLLKKLSKFDKSSVEWKKERGGSSHLNAFEFLLLHLAFQLLTGSGDAEGIVDDLLRSYSTLRKANAPSSSSSSSSKRNDNDSDQDASAILMDALVAVLASPSAVLRQRVGHVFRAMTSYFSKAAIAILSEVLVNDDLVAAEDSEEDDVEEIFSEPKIKKRLLRESNENSGKGKKEKASAEEEEDSQSEDSDDDEDDDDDDDEDEDDDEEEGGDEAPVDLELKRKLEAAMKLKFNNQNDDDDSASDWDDDKMLAVDDALAATFRIRKAQESDKREVVNFRMRILDLYELYVRKEASNPLVLDLIPSLMHSNRSALATQSSNKAYSERITNILKNKMCHNKEVPLLSALDEEHTTLLKSILEGAVKIITHAANPPELTSMSTALLMYIARIVFRGAQEDRQYPAPLTPLGTFVVDHLKGILEIMLGKGSVMRVPLFEMFFENHDDVGWHLVPLLRENLSKGKKLFHKLVCVTLLQKLLGKKKTLLARPDFMIAQGGPLVSSILPLLHEVVQRGKGKPGEDKIKDVRACAELLHSVLVVLPASAEYDKKGVTESLQEITQYNTSKNSPALRTLVVRIQAQVTGEVLLQGREAKKRKAEQKRAERVERRAKRAKKVEAGQSDEED